MEKKVVLVEGTRTPFLKSGTGYFDLMSYQLGAMAINGLITKSRINAKEVEKVIMGPLLPF